jgi:hypothetical protein
MREREAQENVCLYLGPGGQSISSMASRNHQLVYSISLYVYTVAVVYTVDCH